MGAKAIDLVIFNLHKRERQTKQEIHWSAVSIQPQ
jgi:hypothetical protein